MSCVLRIEGRVDGQPSPVDGTYLQRFDFLDCGPYECNLYVVPTAQLATRYPSSIEALEAWSTVDPRDPERADGKPNRPLTIFSVTIEDAPA